MNEKIAHIRELRGFARQRYIEHATQPGEEHRQKAREWKARWHTYGQCLDIITGDASYLTEPIV